MRKTFCKAVLSPSAKLLHAAEYGYVDEVSSVIADGLARREVLEQAAIVALLAMQNDVASVLIDAGIRVNEGVLHAAANGNSPGIVRKLVSLGADANAVLNGKTPLEEWWERSQQADVGLGGDYVLLELIRAGASGCRLFDHLSELNVAAQSFLRSGAAGCAVD